MVAVAKKEPYVGFTLKAILASMVLEGATLKQIETVAKENFPRKFSTKIQLAKLPKSLGKLLRALHRGKLRFDKIETVHVPPPTTAISIKGVEFTPPKSYLSPVKPVSSSRAEAKASKGQTVSVEDDDEASPTPATKTAKPAKALAPKKGTSAKLKPKPSKPVKKAKPSMGHALPDEEVEEVE